MKAVAAGLCYRIYITAPVNLPYSASKLFVIRYWNSATESMFGISPAPLFLVSLTSPLFTRKAFALSGCPFTEILPAFEERPLSRGRSVAAERCWASVQHLPAGLEQVQVAALHSAEGLNISLDLIVSYRADCSRLGTPHRHSLLRHQRHFKLHIATLKREVEVKLIVDL